MEKLRGEGKKLYNVKYKVWLNCDQLFIKLECVREEETMIEEIDVIIKVFIMFALLPVNVLGAYM